MNTELIRAEIERIKGQVEKWEGEVAALNGKIGPARKELEHWSGILQLRQPEQPSLDLQTEEPLGGEGTPGDQLDAEGQPEYGAKAKALREFVRSSGELGVTMSELVGEATRLGSHGNSAYRFVSRLTKTQPPELKRRLNRFVATEHMKQ
jgi:hypothetical protein